MVKVYDSLFAHPSNLAVKHACRMLNYQGESITVVNQKVQKQSNSNDWGLFAIAFATTLYHGGNPSKTRYDQTALKKHLVNCLESLEVTLFPETSTQVPWHTTVGHKTVTIYCLCRMPNDKREYVQCAGCDDWYQPRCAKIPASARNTKRKWFCSRCKPRR